MHTDPDLARLLRVPGDYDLSAEEAAEVLQVSRCTIERAVAKGALEAKRHAGRGRGHAMRIRIPRAAVVRYLVSICTGDRAVLLSAIAAQCPEYLRVAQGLAETQPLPENVIPIRRRPRRAGDPYAGHPDLFAS